MRQARFEFRYGDPGDHTFLLTTHWTALEERSVIILSRQPNDGGGIRRQKITVENAIHPTPERTSFSEEERPPGGPPWSFTYCAPLNEQELRRAHRHERAISEKAEAEPHITDSKPHKAELQFYGAIKNRFFLWFHRHDIEAPDLGESRTDGPLLNIEDRRFVEDMEYRRRAAVRKILPTKDEIDDFDFKGGLENLGKALLTASKQLAQQKGVEEAIDFPKAASMKAYAVDKTPNYLTSSQRLLAIYYWGHGMDELDEMTPRL